jgi:hypothetical protein
MRKSHVRESSGALGSRQAHKWIIAADSVAVLTGAGISAESGIPTFMKHLHERGEISDAEYNAWKKKRGSS